MLIMAFDTDRKKLRSIVKTVRMTYRSISLVMFTDPADAEAYAKGKNIDVLLSGIKSGKMINSHIKAASPNMVSVFVDDSDDSISYDNDTIILNKNFLPSKLRSAVAANAVC